MFVHCVDSGPWQEISLVILLKTEKSVWVHMYMPTMDYCTCQQVYTNTFILITVTKVRMYMKVSHLTTVLPTLCLCSECVMTLQTEMSTVGHPNVTMVVQAICYHKHDTHVHVQITMYSSYCMSECRYLHIHACMHLHSAYHYVH